MKSQAVRLKLLVAAAVVCCGATSVVHASTVTVLPNTTTTLDPTHWSSAFLGDNSGGGNSSITATAPRSGNGSIELFGDRTRFVDGNYYFNGVPGVPAANQHGLLSQVQSLTFDWSVALNSISVIPTPYSPSLILYVQDGNSRSQLIWESVYNGQTSITQGAWYTSGVNDKFYKSGTSENDGVALTSALSTYGYSSNAYISAIGVGVGSGPGSAYHAFADNITLTTRSGGSTTYNFETSAPAGATVPDNGSTVALLGLAVLALVGVRHQVRA